MKYTLTKLMKDKKQCNALAKEGFVFRDHNGIFAFDFAVQPARQIHTEIFNTLFEMGGDDFMQYMLERGGTCVANDPNAATGTRPIKGSDKFFLKANTSKVLAVSSVLTAILGWAEYSDDFDGDAVMLYTLDEEDFDDVTVDDDESMDFDDTDEDASFDLSGPDWYVDGERAFRRTSPIHKNCFLATKKDKLCFYDEDQNQFVTLFWDEGFERMPLDGMVTCEALNDLYEENFGYKYQITEGGKYGFISKYFAQITKPVFDDIAVASDKWGRTFLVAHRAHEEDVFNSPFAEDNSSKEAETETIDLFYSYSAYYHDGNPESERLEDYWFAHLVPAFKNVATYYKADSCVRLDFETDEEGNSAVLYKPYDSAPHAICKIKKNGEWYETVWQVKHADGFMTMTSHNKEIKYPCSSINAETCLRALQPVDLGYEIINLLEWSENYIAILRKEGYYAAATVSFEEKPEIQEWLTPFAFTAMQNMNTRFLLVDRFGKKGVFDCLNETYPVPCDYETIVRSSDFFSGAFRVERMGFTGVIDNDGTWIEHLHKKQD